MTQSSEGFLEEGTGRWYTLATQMGENGGWAVRKKSHSKQKGHSEQRPGGGTQGAV